MKRLALIASVFPFLLQAYAARAAEPSLADAEKVAQCVEAALEGGGFGGDCVGMIADPCMDQDEDISLEDAKRCASGELAIWCERLERAVQQVRNGGFEDTIDAQELAQKSWSESIDTLCPVFDTIDRVFFRVDLSIAGCRK